jgi:hypothetical protein
VNATPGRFLCLWVLVGPCVGSPLAQTPRNTGVSFDGEVDVAAPLTVDQWHTITASYQHVGRIDTLTNTYLVLSRGGDLRTGFYIGYNLPANQLTIVRHGYWNEPEAAGVPGTAGAILENDQGYVDCAGTKIDRTADDITVTYRAKFKPGVLRGGYSVFLYVEDKDAHYEGFTSFGMVTIDADAGVHRTDMPPEWRNALRPEGRAETLSLAEDGQARYALVVPRAPEPIERKAASDLAHNLKLISGADFPIVGEDSLGPGQRPFISIGRTELLATSDCAWKGAELAAEGYAIEVSDGNAYVYGGSGRGLMNGIYSLLEEDLGCRWYSTDSVDTPSMSRLTVNLVPRKYVPVLELRDPYIHKMHDPTWSLHNKTNTPHAPVPRAWGGGLRYHSMGHTYAGYFPAGEYLAEHPEYYALVNGKRQPSQLCHTNEDVIRLSVEKTCEIFRNHPEETITAIGPNDGRGFCDCPECKRLDDANGGRSGSYFYFLNRIAEGVKKEFPSNHLISLAYLDYAKPPTTFAVDDYIIIQLCTDSHAWKYQFCFVWESSEFQEALKAWHAAHARVFIWDYTTDYVHYLVPMANWPVVAGNTRFNIENGATGIMYESELNDVDEMRGWVWAKQLWNPALDTKALMHDFVFGYYKESARPIWDYEMAMWDYWERWHREPHRCGVLNGNPLLSNLQCSYAPDGPMFSAEFMRDMRDSFTEAEALARSDTIRSRVRRAKVSLLYLELCQGLGYYTEFGDFVEGRSAALPRAERQAYQPRLDEFLDICRENGLTNLGIPITVDKVAAKWQECIGAESPVRHKVYLPAEWLFAPDAGDRGVAERWYADPRHYAAAARPGNGPDDRPPSAVPPGEGLTWIHVNRGVGWEQQGFAGLEGYGWYFQYLDAPGDLADRKHLYLYLMGVNEEAWVYLNGSLAFERSYASTGRGPGELAGEGFAFDAKDWLKLSSRYRIAIRVSHSVGLGGISMPAMLVATDDECTAAQLDAYRY